MTKKFLSVWIMVIFTSLYLLSLVIGATDESKELIKGEVELYEVYTSSETWTCSKSGWYRIWCVGASGDGGDGASGQFTSNKRHCSSGSGGNSGAIAISDLYFKKGAEVPMTINGVASFGEYMTAEAGANGNDGRRSDSAPSTTAPYSTARAYGGNVLNAYGFRGGDEGARGGNNGGIANSSGGGARYADTKYTISTEELTDSNYMYGGSYDHKSGGGYKPWNFSNMHHSGDVCLSGAGGGGRRGEDSGCNPDSAHISGGGGKGQPALIIMEKAIVPTEPEIVTTPDKPWLNHLDGNVTITISSDELESFENAKLMYSYDNSSWTEYSTPLNVEKTTTIFAKVTFADGESEISQKEIKIDKVMPFVVSINVDKENRILLIQCQDLDSGIKNITINDSTYNGDSFHYTYPEDMTLFSIEIEDNAGNIINEIFTSPIAPIVEAMPGREWYGIADTAEITLSKSQLQENPDAVIIWYYIKGKDNDEWKKYESPFKVTSTSEIIAKTQSLTISSDPVTKKIKYDLITPSISAINFSEDAKNVTIAGTDEGGSGFKGVYVNDVFKFAEENGKVTAFIPDDVYSLKLEAMDGAGNKADIRTEAVPDVVPPTIDSCTFAGGGLSAVIKASDKGSSGLKGIYVNDQFYEGDTVDYTLPEGSTSVTIQAEDNAGNKSEVKTETVPDNIPPVIESVEFAKDNKSVSILLSDTGGSGVKGATINGQFFEGSEITYTVPDGAKYLEIQAMDKLNNKSETMKKRVPGWSEVVDTITIKPVEFRENNTMATITAETSLPNTTIAGIYVNDVLYSANPVIYKVPDGATTMQLQAVNNEGDKSVIYNLDVPKWGGGVRITSVSFSEQNDFTKKNMEAYIKAVDDTGHNITGIYVNGEFFDGDAITYTIAPGTRHIEIQAINSNGDTSEMMIKRVPGWSEVVDTISIESVNFASSGIATITAASTGPEVSGIYVNDKFYDGNPVLYTVTSSTKTLKLQAENEEGDKSAVIYKEVTFDNKAPIVNSLAVNSVAFDDAIATVSATSTGADVSGIYVNDKLYDGNPVLYPITSSTKTLKAQAVNVLGERSPVVYKEVPANKKSLSSSTDKGKARISISAPDWTSARKAKVKIIVSDKNGIDTVTASTDYGTEEDITDDDYIYITKDTTVTVEVKNDNGEVTKKSTSIECFDRDAPTVSVSQADMILNIKANDQKSGVAKIYVNNKLYRVDGQVSYNIPNGATTVNIFAEDRAGNKSDAIDYPLKKEQKPITAIPAAAGAVTTVTPTPTPPAPTPESPEGEEIEAEEDSGSEEQPFINLLPDPELKPKKEKSSGTVGKVIGSILLMGGSGAGIWYYFHKKHSNILPESSLDDDYEYEYIEDDDVKPEQLNNSESDDESENVKSVEFKVS